MNPPPPTATPAPAPRPLRRSIWLAGGALALATLAVYSGTFYVPFVFDDPSSVLTNASLRQLWPPWTALSPPPLVTVSGRPVVNFTLALNHALGGTSPAGYHAVNLAIHILAGLVFFGLVRRTLHRPPLAARFGSSALPLALAAAALWSLHPLQTESVTYVVQRVESLMGLWYLLTLYAFVRAVDVAPGPDAGPPHRRTAWLVVSVAASLLGMGSKEVMVSAPLLVLLYDRTFVAGSFRTAWKNRARYYAALAATWLLLGGLVLGTGGRGGTAGLNTDLSVWTYALTQLHAVALYLKLAFWPYPLVFDYGTDVVRHFADIVAPGLLVAALAGGIVWALWRRPALGFLGAWGFAILAPTSSIVPIATQTVAEHRMYLPLAAIVLAALLVGQAWIGRVAWVAALSMAFLFGGLTWTRNRIYHDELTLWTDTVAKRPGNARAHYNLAETLARTGQGPAAIEHYQDALRLDPNYAEAYNNLGVLLRQTGRGADARECFERSVRIDAGNPISRYNLGDALTREGSLKEAVAQFRAALELQPGHFEALNDLGGALLALGRDAEAVLALEHALRLRPEFAEAHSNLGLALLRQDRLPEAEEHFVAVLRTAPRDATAHSNLGYLALRASRMPEAVAHYRLVAQERPAEPESHFNLGIACLRAGLPAEATTALEAALRLRPDYPEARQQLARLRGAPLR